LSPFFSFCGGGCGWGAPPSYIFNPEGERGGGGGGYLHDAVALPPVKNFVIFAAQKAGSAPELVWALWRRAKSFPHAEN